ncbi:hypothetical protein AB0E10_01085 [Streptomyces sp. NPDC048045]|uniref:hypothetical protein n=1 Tax=Streptomyces sp. NPDC048045 TaxID=3154710 RepID=UPI00341EEE68
MPQDRNARPGTRSHPLGAGGENALVDDPMPEDGLGAPLPGELSGREARTTEGLAPDAWPAAPCPAPAARTAQAGDTVHTPLLPHEETQRCRARLRQAAAAFADAPRAAVEDADRALEEIAERFGQALARRRRTLRTSWQDAGEKDTEQLRPALHDYEELAERLLRL